MGTLLVAATVKEIAPTMEWIKERKDIQLLITGVGITAATYALSAFLRNKRPGQVVQAGIGGSFSEDYPPGSLALIGEEVIADLGAIENGKITNVFDMGLADHNQHPYVNGMLVNPQRGMRNFNLNFVRGATINCVSSTPQQVAMIREKYNPVIESMEGAALHYVCLMEDVPFLQLRAVSNFTGERNKANWKIREAIENLNNKLKEIIQ